MSSKGGVDSFVFSPVGRRHSSKDGGAGHRVSVAFTPSDQLPSSLLPTSAQATAAPPPPPPASNSQDHAPRSPVSSSFSAAPVGQASTASVSRHIAWCCGSCGYHMLAMDHNGQPLVLASDAFGKPIPLQCPRCALEHTNWEQSVPFDKNGDYVNIRSAFSNHVIASSSGGATTSTDVAAGGVAGIGKDQNALTLLQRPTTQAAASSKGSSAAVAVVLPAILQSIGTVTYKDDQIINLAPKKAAQAAAPLAYYCGKCSRRMQRVDQFGKLVPLELDPYGKVVPMTCPGCKATHAEWQTKPFLVGSQ